VVLRMSCCGTGASYIIIINLLRIRIILVRIHVPKLSSLLSFNISIMISDRDFFPLNHTPNCLHPSKTTVSSCWFLVGDRGFKSGMIVPHRLELPSYYPILEER
jgi:hypothetical protein